MKLLIVRPGKIFNAWRPFFSSVGKIGVDVTALTSMDNSDVSDEFYKVKRAPFRLYNEGHNAVYFLSKDARRGVLQIQPTHIHLIGEPGYLSTWQISRIVRKARGCMRLSMHAAQNVSMKYPLPFSYFERQSFTALGDLFGVSNDTIEVYTKKGFCGRTHYLPLGVDTVLFRKRVEQSQVFRIKHNLTTIFTVGFLGNFVESKDISTLVRACAHISFDYRLVLVGSGPLEREIMDLAMSLGIGHRVQVVGRVDHDEVPVVLSSFDVLVLPSKSMNRSSVVAGLPIKNKEQFGRVLIEAMACETPVIGSDCGEIPRIIEGIGDVFREGDHQRLAKLIERVHQYPDEFRNRTENGRTRVIKNYDWKIVAEKFVRDLDI